MTDTIKHAVLSAELQGIECHTPHAVCSGDTLWTVWQGYQRDDEKSTREQCTVTRLRKLRR